MPIGSERTSARQTPVMKIDGDTVVFGIFGYPVKHTLSPLLHNAVFGKAGKNAIYVPFEVHPDVLFAAVDALRSMGIGGVNVTVPHKEKILQLLDEIPGDVDRAIGAVNTIAVRDGRLYGYNTDGPGFLADLKDQFNFDPKGKSVVMAGAGGAARACAFYLVKQECQTLYLSNRTVHRAEGLRDYLKSFFPNGSIEVLTSLEDLGDESVDLLVNATACGLKSEDPYPMDPGFLGKTRLVYDLIYNPRETKLTTEARRRGLKVSNGVGMLIYQASLAHRVWFPDEDLQGIPELMREVYSRCGA